MFHNRKPLPLLLALAIASALLAGVSWFIIQKLGILSPNISPDNGSQTPVNGSPIPATESFTQVQDIPAGLFNYGGSTTWAPIREAVAPEIAKVLPQFQLRYTNPTVGEPGSSKGIEMLLDSQLSFAQSSRPLKDSEYQTAIQRGFKLKPIPVAIDGYAIAVNPGLKIPGLTLAQLKGIYTGKITNWSQVGGPKLAINPYTHHLEKKTFFAENVLEDEDFGKNVVAIPSVTEALRKVAKTPGGIFYASAALIVSQCTVKPLPVGTAVGKWVPPYQEPFVPPSQCPQQRNQLNLSAFRSGEYPITRRLFVVVKQNGQVDEQAGIAYANLMLSPQGQDLITKAGFVSLR